MDHCLFKLRECETNIEELKNLNVDEKVKYERLIKKNLLIGLTSKVKILVRGLNEVKNINAGGIQETKQSNGGVTLSGFDEEDQSEFNFLSQVRIIPKKKFQQIQSDNF